MECESFGQEVKFASTDWVSFRVEVAVPGAIGAMMATGNNEMAMRG